MANGDNIKDFEFNKRTASERRELAIKGGKASGVVRRKKANFKKTLNALLTAEIDSPEWRQTLESLGVETTLETAMNMAMIKKALEGSVTAAKYVAKYSGQSAKAEEDLDNIKADIELKRARKEEITGENESQDAVDKLDEILKGIKENAAKQ